MQIKLGNLQNTSSFTTTKAKGNTLKIGKLKRFLKSTREYSIKYLSRKKI